MENDIVESEEILKRQKNCLLKVKSVLDCLQTIKALRPITDKDFVVSLRDFFSETQELIRSKNQADTILYRIRDEGGGINVEPAKDLGEVGSATAYIISIDDNEAFKAYIAKIDNELESFKSKESLSQKEANPEGLPSFDANEGSIIWGKKKCKLPFKRNEYYLCEVLFSKPFGTRVSESNILEAIDRESSRKEGQRTVYDAVIAVNKRAAQAFGIKKFLGWNNSNTWISI